VLLQYTVLTWSCRKLPFGALAASTGTVVQGRGALFAVVSHEGWIWGLLKELCYEAIASFLFIMRNSRQAEHLEVGRGILAVHEKLSYTHANGIKAWSLFPASGN
jgi:hypothetical protein